MERPNYYIGSQVRLTLMRPFDVAGEIRDVVEGEVVGYPRHGVELVVAGSGERVYLADGAIAVLQVLRMVKEYANQP